MEPLSSEQLRSVADARQITYEAIPDDDRLVVRTRMSREFPIGQKEMYELFADPSRHVGIFKIIVGSTPPIRSGIEDLVPENSFYAFEHVQEGNLPPRLMLAKYTLTPPSSISKEMVTDPFSLDSEVLSDRKRGALIMSFDAIDENTSRFSVESRFHAENGSVFARGFIDRVWLNFFERMMSQNGILEEKEFLT